MSDDKVGVVFKYFQGAGVAGVEVLNIIRVGDSVQFLGTQTNFSQSVDSMQADGEDVEEAVAGDKVGIKVGGRVRLNDRVYRVSR